MPRCLSRVASSASFVLPYASLGSMAASSSVDVKSLSGTVSSGLSPICCSNELSWTSPGMTVVFVECTVVDRNVDELGCNELACFVNCGISFGETGRPKSVDSNCKSEFSDATSFLFFSMSLTLIDVTLPIWLTSAFDGGVCWLGGDVWLNANLIICLAKSGFRVVFVVLVSTAIWRWKREKKKKKQWKKFHL